MATDTATDSAAEKTTRKKGYAPTDGDYVLKSVRIEKAENGVVVSCGYDLKDDVKEKMRAQEKQGIYGIGSMYCDDEKSVFETEAAAKAFIMKELNDLWPDGE